MVGGLIRFDKTQDAHAVDTVSKVGEVGGVGGTHRHHVTVVDLAVGADRTSEVGQGFPASQCRAIA